MGVTSLVTFISMHTLSHHTMTLDTTHTTFRMHTLSPHHTMTLCAHIEPSSYQDTARMCWIGAQSTAADWDGGGISPAPCHPTQPHYTTPHHTKSSAQRRSVFLNNTIPDNIPHGRPTHSCIMHWDGYPCHTTPHHTTTPHTKSSLWEFLYDDVKLYYIAHMTV